MNEQKTPQEVLAMFTSKSDIRAWMLRPFRLNGFVYASNGHWIVRVPDDASIDADPITDKHPKKIEGMFAEAPQDGFAPLPAIEKPGDCEVCRGRGFGTLTKCADCGGEGEFRHGSHWYDCRECDGEGDDFAPSMTGTDVCFQCDGLGLKTWREPGHTVGLAKFAGRYLWLLRVLPGIQIAAPTKDGKARFIFDGGDGLLMPLRD